MPDPVWCANCGNQIYKSGAKWYHTSTASMSCEASALAIPSVEADRAAVVAYIKQFDEWIWCLCPACRSDINNHTVNAPASLELIIGDLKAGKHLTPKEGSDVSS